tara:strand:- start:87 stop:371 length:285 start_codon:yes stop_codon:yes gene_type:complete
MSKTLYYRETDPKTGKAKWIKLNGVRGTNNMIFITTDKNLKGQKWEESQKQEWAIVYKSTKETKRRTFEQRVKEGEKFEYDLSEDDKLRLMTRK